MVVLIVIAVVLLLLVVLVLWQFNKLRKLDVDCDEGFAQIEVQLTRRSELIPNLVETVKGYAKHEQTVLEAVTNPRAGLWDARDVAQTAPADAALTSALRGVMLVAENYPDLKASANFLQLQEELTTTENKIAFARQFYNESVRILNSAVVTVPSMFFTGIAKVGKRPFYEVPDEAQRIAPDVGFA